MVWKDYNSLRALENKETTVGEHYINYILSYYNFLKVGNISQDSKYIRFKNYCSMVPFYIGNISQDSEHGWTYLCQNNVGISEKDEVQEYRQ